MPTVMRQRSFKYLPLSLRLATVGGVATPLVLRGTPLPASRSEIFSTAEDNQSSVEVNLAIGERPLVRDNVAIGRYTVRGIPPAKSAVPQVKVTFEVDTSCAVVVRTEIEGTDLKGEQKYDPPIDLSDDKISQLLQEAEENKTQDEQALQHVEAVNRANSLLRTAEERLKARPNGALSAAVAALGLSLQASDSAIIRDKTEGVQRLLTPTFDIFGSDSFASFFAKPKTPSKAKRTQTPRSGRGVSAVQSTSQNVTLGKIFGGGSFTLDPQLCFVLMPFSAAQQPLYEDHLKPTVESAGLRCQRADDIPAISLITWDIWERVNRARFLIAELTGQNPNVFYELGLAHALGKDVILLTQSMDHVPFDLKAIRCIVYEFTPRGTQKLVTRLKATIDALMKLG